MDKGLWQVSIGGGQQPLWSRNGRELFYVAPDDALMAVAIEAKGSMWSAGVPIRALAGPFYRAGEGGPSSRQYDVSPDGQRFLMLKAEQKDTDAITLINVVQNWFEELKRLVPTK